MPRRTTLLAAMVVVALTSAGCGSPPGSSGAESSADDPAAVAAAKELGINLKDCPTDVTAKFGAEVNVGASLPLSGGPAATAFAGLADGMNAAFDEANANLGLATKFKLVVKDDQFLPDKALAAAQELVQKDQVEAMSGILGTPQVLADRDLLNKECVPMVPAVGGGSVLVDPVNHPWAVPLTQPFSLDTRIWVEHVNEVHPDGVKIALFTGNTASGKDYATNVKKWLAATGSKSKIVVEDTIEGVDAAAPSSQVTTMRNSGADVLMAAPTGAQCISLMTELANQGWTPETYLTGTCFSTGLFAAAGAAGDKVMVALYLKDPDSPRFKNDADVKRIVGAMEKYVPDAKINTTTLSGYMVAESFAQAAKGAASSDLGLSRLGLMQAAHHLNYHPAQFLDGVNVKLDGADDPFAVEASELNSWNAKTRAFEPIKLYDFEGQLSK
jgi:branched-chain amino acid transport system substrate-binding protein